MAKCEECGREYWQEKSWQRFCNPKCRDDWHNHQKKLAQVTEAEELREERLANGNGANGNGAAPADYKPPLSDLLKSLRPAEPKQPSLVRRV